MGVFWEILPHNINQLMMIQGRTGKISASSEGTETYMVGSNASTNEKGQVYNSTLQAVLRGVVKCAT